MCDKDFFKFMLCYTAAVCFQQCSGVDSCVHRVVQQAAVNSVVEPTVNWSNFNENPQPERGIWYKIPRSGQSMEFRVKYHTPAVGFH